MRTYQLCTYRFVDAAAAQDYLPRWRSHIGSLEPFAIRTHGFFSVPHDPRMVIAIISFESGVDPDAAIKTYMASDGFAKDMEGFDMSRMERDEKLTLVPGPGSPMS